MKFDSREYSWSNLEVVMLLKNITKIRGVKYASKKEKEYLHAKGDDPHAIQSGNKTYDGEIILLQSEVEALDKLVLPHQDLTDLAPFNLIVSYVDKNSNKITTHTLKSVEFTEDSRETKQGDKFMEITLPIMFLGRKTV